MWSETVGLLRPVLVYNLNTVELLSQTMKIGLGLGLGLCLTGLCCVTRSCYARRQNDIERHGNFSSTIYVFFSILCLEHHYCGDHQWRSLT